MKARYITATSAILLAATLSIYHFNTSSGHAEDLPEPRRTSGALKAIEQWTFERSYPGNTIPVDKYQQAFEQLAANRLLRSDGTGQWEQIGPYNVAGRTLALAFHPYNPDIIFAGSASGGLWKTVTAGKGAVAWQQIPIGFPVLAVSSIAIHPEHPDTMYIGTGEVYSTYGNTAPGIVNRLTRGTYGLGIFKSTDGGASWTHSLDYALSELKGIQDIEIDPTDHEQIFAASTDGVLRSQDGGKTWELVHDLPMAVDIEIVPGDPKKIFVTHGNLNADSNPDLCGVFVSTNNGRGFTRITDGLPTVFTGKALISKSLSHPDILYASIQHWAWSASTTTQGLYRSDNRGETWRVVNNSNVALYQGWYSHDVAIHPHNPDTIVHVGIDAWRSENGGDTLGIVTNWALWTYGTLPNTGPDGPPDYVHADIHASYFHPLRDSHVYLATDGGVFVSEDYGKTYESRNTGMITTQFHARSDSDPRDSLGVVGGTQDNATYRRSGPDVWQRIFGGDGMSAYFDPTDENIIYGSAQGLYMLRLNLLDTSEKFIGPMLIQGDVPAFNAPFIVSPHEPHTLFAGAGRYYQSLNNGETWQALTENNVDGNNRILHIAADPIDSEILYLCTASDPFALQNPKVFKSTNGGYSWSQLNGLPNRVAKYIAVDPTDNQRVYVVMSGFDNAHVYISDNGGESWSVPESGIPDVPANTLAIDPLNPLDLYLGNDLGVFYSSDAGKNWTPWMTGLPEAVMAMDLHVSATNRKLRVATHGRGIFESPLEYQESTGTSKLNKTYTSIKVYPNPVYSVATIATELLAQAEVAYTIIDMQGKVIAERHLGARPPGEITFEIDLTHARLPSGCYYILFSANTESRAIPIIYLGSY